MNNLCVFVGSPFAWNSKDEYKRNMDYARVLCRIVAENLSYPLAPHLFIPQFLSDQEPGERGMGLNIGRNLLDRMDIAMFGIDYGTSDGMKAEIAHCQRRDIPYRCVEAKYFLSELIKLQREVTSAKDVDRG